MADAPLAAYRRRPGRIRLTLRRIGAHLTRSNARWAYLTAVICIVIYASIPAVWPIADPTKQFVLILASVAIGAVVLPELPSNLWSIDVERVRNLVPSEQREKLAQSLISAESEDDRWNSLVWDKALEPLLKASREPWRYVRDMDYDVSVHLDRTLALGERSIPVHTVSVDSKSTRVLARPGLSAVWISIARSSAALQHEFGQPGCLAREVVPLGGLSGQAWQDAVTSTCSAELSIDGVRIELIADVSPDLPDIVRWRTPAEYELPSHWARVRIMFDFHLDPMVKTFPVLFSGYYCAGTTDIALRMYDENTPSELECDYFVGRALEENSQPSTRESSNGVHKQITFSTGRDGILWPGSGVMFRWEAVQ